MSGSAAANPAVIDIHTHIVPDKLPAYAGRHKELAWPSIRHTGDCQAQVIVAGQVFRTIDDACWNPQRRAVGMERMGVGTQVLSPMPELLSYWMPAKDAADLGAAVNETIAEMVRAHPARFLGLGMVTLQEPDRAAGQLGHVVRGLGLAGVEIGSNVNGVSIGDARFDGFFAEAAALGAAVFVHALRPAGMDRLVGPPALEQVVAFPSEMALAVASLLTGGVVARHPGLRLACSHGGGGFAMTLPRLEHAWGLVPELREAMPASPRELARRLFYDTLVYDDAALSFLLRSFTPRQLVVGSDYPFKIMDERPAERLRSLELPPADRDAVLHGNACRFLAIGS